VIHALYLLSLVAACGGAPQETDSRAQLLGEAAPTEPLGAPSTHRDPPPYTPLPAPSAQTGEASALRAAGGYDQARAVALAVVEAVRDRDEATLNQLVSDPVGRVLPRLSGPTRSRDAVLRQILHSPRRQALGPDIELDALIDASRMTVTPLSRLPSQASLPSGLLGSDLMVRFPLAATGRQLLRYVLSWAVEGAIVVRPGSEPRVMAL